MSKFSGILNEAKKRKEKTPSPSSEKPQKDENNAPSYISETPTKRPVGRRSDPRYMQANAYIPKDLHREIKIALIKEGKERQFSELVEDLLSTWIKSNR